MQKILRTLNPLYRFSTKKAQRIQNKIQDVKDQESTSTLESVAEQNTFTDEQMVKIIEDRRQFIKELTQETKAPREVKYITIATLSPLLLLSSATLYSCINPAYAIYTGQLMHATIKYASINVAFQSGIHWGFAMSQHETQLDWLNSSSEARTTFFLASIPIIGAILISQYFLYGNNDNIQSISAIIGTAILNLMVTGLDIRARSYTPGWFLKNKLFYSFGFNVALIPLIYCVFLYGDNFKNKESIYRVQ
ncbi:unnamed protein product (macronuclear) [Paramecium tetraurelia]|uniref:Chromosome undetermined scaffold_1, whole genome shotgun sequence n=1 Tax=Paramecium tetraurelia TaxID=5888 RepID=Q6BFN3_PARTE|nr:hypothetical protein [Paramecium tetraurelia strain d4-2]XP_001423119.1 uncharacterized protein GSPATT00000156001 [Paramecium tetraurelia]CAH03537.1 hypothetical protein, transmembrane helices [Paramecium tetraurelia]CAK55721.1 unnamed protein product [Paramecium tetraurelia]|eukprot:XP_001423119.1 hypothetical protein (macronuclear) [Paramecium tetraurelia strain d4-2]